MAPSSPVRPLGWTRRNVAMTMLAAVAEQRAQSAARLAQAIEASGKSFETLAHDAGVSTKTISRWVNQKHDPNRHTVERVAKALNVEENWLWEPPAPLGLGYTEPGPTAEELGQVLTELVANQEKILTRLGKVMKRLRAIEEKLDVFDDVDLPPLERREPPPVRPRARRADAS